MLRQEGSPLDKREVTWHFCSLTRGEVLLLLDGRGGGERRVLLRYRGAGAGVLVATLLAFEPSSFPWLAMHGGEEGLRMA
jgi:hypothetical protein